MYFLPQGLIPNCSSLKDSSLSINFKYVFPSLFFRELAIQIAEQFEALGSGIGIKCAVVSFLITNYEDVIIRQ